MSCRAEENAMHSSLPRSLTRPAALACFVLAFCNTAHAAELLPVTANTNGALTITCEHDLHFGSISLPANNSSGTVIIAATSTGAVTSTFPTTGYSQGLCTVTNVADEESAIVAISGGGGAWNPVTGELTGAKLTSEDDPLDTLDVLLVVDRTDGITTDPAPAIGTPIYIGGTLSIPADVDQFGTYIETFTITVTE